MIKNAFIDTNLAIAYVYHINSLHNKSKKVIEEYDNLFWSFYVEYEFNRRSPKKYMNLSTFFHDLQKFLENPKKELYCERDLEDFALNNYSGKLQTDAKNSIKPFWNEYFGVESWAPFSDIKYKINSCLIDLTVNSVKNLNDFKKNVSLTPQRAKNYPKIDSMLKSEGVHENDRIVTLDGHNFACKSSNTIDFVTFDNDCFNGAKNVELLCFNSIKGKDDFTAS